MYCATCGSANPANALLCAKCSRPLSVRPSTMVGVAPQGSLSSAPPATAPAAPASVPVAAPVAALQAATTFDPTIFEAAQAAMAQEMAEPVTVAPAPVAAPARAAKGTMLGMGAFVAPVVAASVPAPAAAAALAAAPVASSRRIGGAQGLVIPAGAMINVKRQVGSVSGESYPTGAARPVSANTPREPWLVVVLGLVTFGVYYFYWLNAVAQQLNAQRGDGTPNPVKLVLLSLATLGIYSWVWRAADAGKQIAEAQARAGVSQATDLGIVALIPFYGVYAMQRELNRLA